MEPSIIFDTIPPDILDAAEKVRTWAERTGNKYWQLGGICDRRFAQRYDLLAVTIDLNEKQTEEYVDRIREYHLSKARIGFCDKAYAP